MRKDVFNEIGGLDDEMEGWGGENLDLAIKVFFIL
jgi:hypothetical protein